MIAKLSLFCASRHGYKFTLNRTPLEHSAMKSRYRSEVEPIFCSLASSSYCWLSLRLLGTMTSEQLIGRSSSLHRCALTSVVRIMPCCDSANSAYSFCPTFVSCTSAPLCDSAISRYVLVRSLELVEFTSADREAEYPCPLVLRSHVLWNKGYTSRHTRCSARRWYSLATNRASDVCRSTYRPQRTSGTGLYTAKSA